MDESWNTSLSTGDQCALCENPLGDDAIELADPEGKIYLVCGACALRVANPDGEEAVASLAVEAVEAARTLDAVMVRRAQEQADLEATAATLVRVAADMRRLETHTLELEQRVHALEGELARTRERLRRAEELLATTSAEAPASTDATPAVETGQPTAPSAATLPTQFAWVTEPDEAAETVSPQFPPPAPSVQVDRTGLDIETIHQAQRVFNEYTITDKMRSVRRSLGRPIVNLSRVVGPVPRVLVTVAWEIVWYQFLVDLGDDAPSDERVSLFAEGMELSELAEHFTEPNAMLDDEGRVDASELEFQLLEQRDNLLTEMSAEEEAALEDATEEVWDRHTPPEFRWDD